LYVEGDIFKINKQEYRVRYINKYEMCWLEPILLRKETWCLTGGLNKVYHIEDLMELEYIDECY
jgi:hypothetical protein